MTSAMRGSPASPLSLHRYLPERSSPSRVRFAAQKRRALDGSGPFRRFILEKGKGANAKSPPAPARTENTEFRAPPLDDVNNPEA